MGAFEDLKPVIALVVLQFTYAGLSISTRYALLQGMSPRVFIVYRQAIAALVIAPIAYFSQRAMRSRSSLGIRSFSLIFIASLIGVTINQNVYFEGLYMASASIASAMGNLLPAVTFLIAAILGLEKVDIRSFRTIAKVVGTLVCVGGALSIALIKGPKLLHATQPTPVSHSGGENWLMGCLLLFGSSCCWSIWLILQVPMSASYPDHVSLSAWMCFFGALQSAILAFILEPDLTVWKLHSSFELLCCFYAGIVGSAASFYIQSWCISRRGPLFSAMFNPLGTVIITVFACLLLHEKLYVGSMAGSVAVVVGLYAVLWSKAKDLEEMEQKKGPRDNPSKMVTVVIDEDESLEKSCKTDLKEPLLNGKSSDGNGSEGISR
ncbi:PREDICTED: WAT1-related protein At4g30420-like [Nelumbo nucifera]|uniref:WAT1-related protein n=2 Tax=Nelumbo nucifera TaxID=4432 RepID=A0A822YDL6_NELNU|nr:PREDICTED: WAT1-related protein At4g30420-like [Nelumbo nucifera]DAD27578.1 TPA_asm: hypothetical protein HUJ06_029046 [Nelumbo nucifera]